MKCIICNDTKTTEIYSDLLKCSTCGLVYYKNMDIADEELKKLYQEGYFSGEEYIDYKEDKKNSSKKF